MAEDIADSRRSFFPKVDGAILRAKHVVPPASRPQTIGPIFDRDNFDRPIEPWSPDVERTFYPKTESETLSVIPDKPSDFANRYLRAFLADQERLRLSVLWYYTRDILQEDEFLAGVQEKAQLAQESVGWEYAVIGILDIDVYIRLATVGLELGILPRGETLCAHTVTQPPGNVFLIPELLQDWRFQQCPYLESGGLYAYAGVPLRLRTDSSYTANLGTLCVASKTGQEPLNKAQHQALVRLADWVVSDLVQCTRARRQRERRRMADLLAKAQKETSLAVSTEPVFEILRTMYPGATVRLQPARATVLEFDEGDSVTLADLNDGLWENVEYLEEHLTKMNHLPAPTDRPARILAASCDSISGSSLLVVATKDFRLVFDDADAWFIQACADTLSQMWSKSLLAEAMIAKEKFLRAFSHQLRTPIHGILGSVELLAEELKSRNLSEGDTQIAPIELCTTQSEIDSRDPATYLNIIKMAGRDLTSIINNLIALNKWSDIAIAQRHYAMHTLDELETEIGNEISKITMGDSRYTCSLFFDQKSSPNLSNFCSDLAVLRDTILPLVINSIQHTQQGIVSVTSAIHAHRKEVVVDVEDNGRGIHPDDHQRIFEPYEKVDLLWAGAGLGLTLASKFASLIHGSIELVSSELGRGSHFRATFREVECDCLSQPRQSLALKLDRLPARFYKIPPDAGTPPLSDRFASFLLQNGFICSDGMENSLIIFDARPDLEQHCALLAQIPSEQVAICLVPISEEKQFIPEIDDNIIYVHGPFMTSTLRSALERAQNYLILKSSQTQLSLRNKVDPNVPTTATMQKDIFADKSAAAPPSTVNSIHLDSTATLSLNSQPEVSVSIDLKISTSILPPSRPSPRPVTLIVDDNAVNLRVMETYCSKRGLSYLSALNGRQAVEIFSKHQTLLAGEEHSAIQLIFMDLQMPVCGGIEATRQIRALEQRSQWRKSFLFVMTGQDSLADREAAEGAGADEYFVKPVVIKQLDRVIKQYFPAFGDS